MCVCVCVCVCVHAYMRACVRACVCMHAWVCAFMFLCVYTCTRTYVCIVYPLTSATHHIFHCLVGHLHSACCEPILSVSKRCQHIDQCVINGIIGTHTSLRHCLPICYNLGPTFLFDKPISPPSIPLIWKLGSTYMGCFLAPVMKDSVSLKIESFL